MRGLADSPGRAHVEDQKEDKFKTWRWSLAEAKTGANVKRGKETGGNSENIHSEGNQKTRSGQAERKVCNACHCPPRWSCPWQECLPDFLKTPLKTTAGDIESNA